MIDIIITWVSDVQTVLDHADNGSKIYLVAYFTEEVWCALHQTGFSALSMAEGLITVLWVFLNLHGEYKSWLPQAYFFLRKMWSNAVQENGK